jgi:hypothetical protein
MLTDKQIFLLRRDLGDTGQNAVLSGGELHMAYQQADGDLSQTRLIALRWLLAHYVKCDPERATHYQTLIDRAERDAGLENGGIVLGLGG